MLIIICTHAHNSAHTEFLSKEASTEYYSLQDCLYRHRKQMCLLLLNEIKQEAISHTSCSMPETWHFDYSTEEVRSPSLYIIALYIATKCGKLDTVMTQCKLGSPYD